MIIYKALMEIKSKKKLTIISNKLLEVLLADKSISKRQILYSDKMGQMYAEDNYKIGGVAFIRDVALSRANRIIWHASRKRCIIKPSPESQMWSQSEGGHDLHWTDKDDEATSTDFVLGIIRNTT